MFPDLTADDIFRIETKRLWLRWPRASDTPAITSFVSLAQIARMTASIPHPYPPGEAERFIMKARTGNASGTALVLAITQKGGLRQTIGLLSATLAAGRDIEFGYVLAPPVWGKGFASEAVKAFADTVFSLTRANRILANSRVNNIASRRVLEKTGFAFVDTGLDFLPARGGLYPCDRFQLDRKTWAASRRAGGEIRHMPPMAQQAYDASEAKVLPRQPSKSRIDDRRPGFSLLAWY
ncbi:MAG: GNAT family N-acetyltransferase [Pseudomonadota bacterium]|nr:GNAT family N-acetyltransferase [Pseudomonadota bacterium]